MGAGFRSHYDAHVRARRALVRRIVQRFTEWSSGDLCGGLYRKIGWDSYRAVLAASAGDALSSHSWRPGWGDKLSVYRPFGGPQRVIGTYADVPAHEVHQIMCAMFPFVRSRGRESSRLLRETR